MEPPKLTSVEVLPDNTFQKKDFTSTGANLHAHLERPRNLVMFVHGFSGHGYNSWSDFPQLLFDGELGIAPDVLLFEYKSGFRAFYKRGAHLPTQTARVLEILNELHLHYKSITIISHSTGGLISESALQAYLTSSESLPFTQQETPVSSIIHFAAPRAGTGIATPILGLAFREFLWLKRFSDRVFETAQFYTDQVQTRAVANLAGFRYFVPRYAVVADGDVIVNRFSSNFNIPTTQISHLAGTHSSVVKPTHLDSSAARIAVARIKEVDDLRIQLRRQLNHADEQLTSRNPTSSEKSIATELWTIQDQPEITAIYNQVRADLSSHNLAIRDISELTSLLDNPVQLLICISDSENMASHEEHETKRVQHAIHRRLQSHTLSVAIALLGSRCIDAIKVARDQTLLFEPVHSNLYFSAALNYDRLRELLEIWIRNIIQRDPMHWSTLNRTEQILEQENTPEEQALNRGYL